MIFNVAIDTLTGFVPLIGDLFDFAWKANNRNLALLERHAYEEHGPSTGRLGVRRALRSRCSLVIAAVPLLLLGWVISLVAGLVR